MKSKLFLAGAFLVSLFGMAQSPCHAGYSYTLGANGQVTFTDTTSGTGGNTTYDWSFGDGQWSGAQNPGTITYAYNGTYLVSLNIRDSSINCNDNFNQYITITNAAVCNLQAAYTYTVDTSGYVHFTNTTANSNAYTTYFWYTPGSQDSAGNNTNFTLRYIYNGSYVVNLAANNTNGVCSSSFSDTIVVTTGITCNLAASYTTSAGSNGLINFSNTSTGVAPGSLTYWDFGYGAYSYQTNPSYTFQYNGNYIVTLNISDSTGNCSGSFLDTVTVTNAATCPSVQAAFTYTLAGNGLVLFQSNSTGTDTGSYFIWDQGDGNGFIDSSSAHSHTYSSNGTYIVSLTVANRHNPCLSAAFTDTIVITNSANCIPSVSFSMVKDTANPGVWSAVANYSSNVTSVVWSWGDGTSSTGFSPTHNYASAGVYGICVSVVSSCGDSAIACQNDSLYRNSSMISVSVINANGVGIAGHSAPDRTITVFPNPSSNGEFSITNVKPGDAIRITNIYGQEVPSEIKKQNGGAFIQIETAGAYFVNVNSKGKFTTLKVIITK